MPQPSWISVFACSAFTTFTTVSESAEEGRDDTNSACGGD